MRIGTIISLPDRYSRYARIKDDNGVGYTVDPQDLPEEASLDDRFAYKVELGSNDSCLAYSLLDED